MFQECSQVYIRREGSVEGPLCPLQIKDIVLQKYRRVSWKITHLVATKCWSNMQCNELFPVCKYYRCKIVCTAIWIFAEVKITTELDKNVNKLYFYNQSPKLHQWVTNSPKTCKGFHNHDFQIGEQWVARLFAPKDFTSKKSVEEKFDQTR